MEITTLRIVLKYGLLQCFARSLQGEQPRVPASSCIGRECATLTSNMFQCFAAGCKIAYKFVVLDSA